jgi:hypothetical protein
MVEQHRAGILEVSVTHQPPRWEWQITFDGEMIANGFEREKRKGNFEGNKALFLLLAAGWNHLRPIADCRSPDLTASKLGVSPLKQFFQIGQTVYGQLPYISLPRGHQAIDIPRDLRPGSFDAVGD